MPIIGAIGSATGAIVAIKQQLPEIIGETM